MEIIIVLLAILQSMAISLGVGSSTLAVLNFFVALKDGKISQEERALMGVVYIVLRIAMSLILFTATVLAVIHISSQGFDSYFTAFKQALWTLVFVLYLNAVLMTTHLMSSKFGPAIQAGSWYTMGAVVALLPLNLDNFSYFQFFLSYIATILLFVVLINSVLIYLRSKKQKAVQK